MTGKVEHCQVAGVQRAGKVADRNLHRPQILFQQGAVAIEAKPDLLQPGGHVFGIVDGIDQRVRSIAGIADDKCYPLRAGGPGKGKSGQD